MEYRKGRYCGISRWLSGRGQLRTAIIIVGYDGGDWLPQLWDGLKETISHDDVVVFVDNGGNVGVRPGIELPCKKEIRCPPYRMGFCDANNFAMDNIESCADLVCFLNQDVVVDRLWLSSIVSVFECDSCVGAVAPAHLTYDFKRLNHNFRSSIRHERRVMSRRLNDLGWFEQDNLIAAAMVVRTAVLAEVGGFDPIFGSYCEDYDLCRRIREAGYKTGVVPASRIGHFDGSATRTKKAELKRERQVVRNWAIHRIRSSKTRLPATVMECCWEMPKRLIKSLLHRPDSQHLGSVLRAWASLIALIPRLISKKLDDRKTQSHFVALKANLKSLITTTDAAGDA